MRSMRILACILACGLLLVAAGCAAQPRQGPAGRTEAPSRTLPHPALDKDAGPVVAQAGKPAPRALPLSATVPALSYRIRQPLPRPPQVSGRLETPLARRWKYIVIHHSATHDGSEANFDRYHRTRKRWKGVGYDFVIGNGNGSPDGLVEVTFRWEKQITGAHAASAGNEYNRYAIGICLVGNLEKDYPTARQMEALVGLVNYLQERCDIPTDRIMGHRHVPGASTKCPGRNFPWYEFLSLLEH